jgi:hypothetical protein
MDDLQKMMEELENRSPMRKRYDQSIYHTRQIPKIPRNIYYGIKWKIQRAQRGYSDRDLCSLDYYLAGVIGNSLRQLMKTAHGHPLDMSFEEYLCMLDRVSYGFLAYYKFQISSNDWSLEKEKKIELNDIEKKLDEILGE